LKLQDSNLPTDKGKEKDQRQGKQQKLETNSATVPMLIEEETILEDVAKQEEPAKSTKVARKTAKSVSGKAQKGLKVHGTSVTLLR